MITFNRDDYRDKVLGCWLGKNIGGTLGAPFEWKRQVNAVDFYAQDLGGDPLPNDDLDIQLLWLIALEEKGVNLTAQMLAEYWCLYVTPHWAEYGIAKVNMRSGLPPPLSGTFNNPFKDSCGAFIRSEIWACIAPGLPKLAAKYAYEDAILDHGNGEGTYAEVFCAALESAAFVTSDLRQLIGIGLSYIPATCVTAQAARRAMSCYDGGKSWQEARDTVLELYRGGTFYGYSEHTSPDDHAKGFGTGKLGFDVPSNIAITVIGLLYGEGDFSRTLCTAVNCGEDTDCTAATAGSIFGIMHGASAIPEDWITPIGRGIKTACLNLGELGFYGDQLPQTVDELTDRTERIAHQVLGQGRRSAARIAPAEPTDLSDVCQDCLAAGRDYDGLYANIGGPVFEFDCFQIGLDYGDTPAIRSGVPKTLKMTIRSKDKAPANVGVRWYLPDGWTATPAAGFVQSMPHPHGRPVALEFTVSAEKVTHPISRAVVELTIEGRPTVMTVPVTLMNGDLTDGNLPLP